MYLNNAVYSFLITFYNSYFCIGDIVTLGSTELLLSISLMDDVNSENQDINQVEECL